MNRIRVEQFEKPQLLGERPIIIEKTIEEKIEIRIITQLLIINGWQDFERKSYGNSGYKWNIQVKHSENRYMYLD